MDGAALRAVALNLDRASSVADAGLAASGAIIDVLARLRDAASSGDGEGVRASRAALNETLQSGAFDGANLLDGSMPGGALRVAVGPADGGGITISGHDLRPGGPVVSLDPDAEGAQAAAQAEAAIIKVETAREQLREDSKRLEAHRSFLTMLSDAVGGEAKNLDVDGARLAALSIKQTIGGTTLALAGGAPQQVLSLFR
jgi:flagellin